MNMLVILQMFLVGCGTQCELHEGTKMHFFVEIIGGDKNISFRMLFWFGVEEFGREGVSL